MSGRSPAVCVHPLDSTTAIADQPISGLGCGETLTTRTRLGPWDVLALAAWLGLAAGWLEVGTRVLCKSLVGTNRLYLTTRHFVWLVPLSNLLLFLIGGMLLAAAAKLWPRLAGWLSPRLLCAAAVLPALMVAGPQVYPWAWVVVAAGISMRAVAWFERADFNSRRWLLFSFPGLLGSVIVVAGSVFGGDWLKERREAARSVPRAGTPNVLLIVLDTVRADRMSLYGYERSTTPALERLAQRGIRFAEARATAPWTLASHATMFSGRLPHDLKVHWQTPLRRDFPTLAEYLGSRGYATAGFVANTEYCSYDTGLDRGFTHYDDYPPDVKHLRPLRTALFASSAWEAVSWGLWRSLGPLDATVRWLTDPGRKDAGSINRDFVDWLSHRQGSPRPFFAFLNYLDAHVPYLPPEGTGFRYGTGPRTLEDFYVLVGGWKTIDKSRLPPNYRELIRDCYDNCLSYLDRQLGELFDTLERRGVLDQTLVIVTSDHGEELGEHGLFEHGESLYRPEIHVPLLIVLPARNQSPEVVRETVSLRDLTATIADLVGMADNAPFPGSSLARLRRDVRPEGASRLRDDDGAISELSGPNPTSPSQGRSPAARGSLVSLAEEDYVYIRNEGDGREQLFHESADPDEQVNLAKVEAMRPRLERLRRRLNQVRTNPPPAAR
ncbi:MAG TPA: sulfatase-like hydrolase/transferase [Isosphaeraceae bacterium]|nr:sulfatase-like hydrolase/transferase [Isosphaeraceae bacterium]